MRLLRRLLFSLRHSVAVVGWHKTRSKLSLLFAEDETCDHEGSSLASTEKVRRHLALRFSSSSPPWFRTESALFVLCPTLGNPFVATILCGSALVAKKCDGILTAAFLPRSIWQAQTHHPSSQPHSASIISDGAMPQLHPPQLDLGGGEKES